MQAVFNEKNMAVIGSQNAVDIVTAPITYNESGLLYISAIDTGHLLLTTDFPFIFSTMPSKITQAQALLNFCLKSNLKRILLVQENAEYFHMQANYFEMVTSKKNIGTYNDKIKDNSQYFQEFVANFNRLSFDAIYIVGSPRQSRNLIKELRKQGNNKPVLIGGVSTDKNVIKIADTLSENIFATTLFDFNKVKNINGSFKYFTDMYEQSFKIPPEQLSYQSYEAVQILAQVWERNGSVSPKFAASTLRAQSGWQGALEKYEFDDKGLISGKMIQVIQLNMNY